MFRLTRRPALTSTFFLTQKKYARVNHTTPKLPNNNKNIKYPLNYNGVAEVKKTNIAIPDEGLRKFLKESYALTGLGIGVTMLSAGALSWTNIPTESPVMCLCAGFLTSLSGILCVSFVEPSIAIDEDGKPAVINPPVRLLGAGLLTIGQGISLSPLIVLTSVISPVVLPLGFALSTLTMGGACYFAMKAKDASLLKYGPAFTGGLIALLGTQLIGLAAGLICGPNIVTDVLFSFDNYVGIALFTGLTAIDTQEAIQKYKEGYPDHISVYINLLLNFVNLLVRFMSILSKRK